MERVCAQKRKDKSLKIKGKMYVKYERSTMAYRSENWAINAEQIG